MHTILIPYFLYPSYALLLIHTQSLYEQTGKPVRLFSSFYYQAQTWACAYRILCKAEMNEKGQNTRFVVTNLESSRASFIYQNVYCARGQMENFIKNHKTFLHSDRTSCHTFGANQFRLFLPRSCLCLVAQFSAHRITRHKVDARTGQYHTKPIPQSRRARL